MDVASIAALMLDGLVARCAEQGLELRLTPSLTDALVAAGASQKYGARPLRRAMQRLCEDPVAEALLGKFARPGEALTLDAQGEGAVVLTNARAERKVVTVGIGQGIEEADRRWEADDQRSGGELLGSQSARSKITVQNPRRWRRWLRPWKR